MTRISPSPILAFHPRLTKAECEFWFEAGQDWQEETELRMESSLARAFPDVSDVTEPFLWFEPNYLAILSGPTGNTSAHTDVKSHSGCVMRALTAYQEAAQPCRVQTLFLNYRFELNAGFLLHGPAKRVWRTSREMMTLEREASCSGLQTHMAVRCLISHPPVCCLAHPERWLEHIHHRMERAFQEIQQGASFEAGHWRSGPTR